VDSAVLTRLASCPARVPAEEVAGIGGECAVAAVAQLRNQECVYRAALELLDLHDDGGPKSLDSLQAAEKEMSLHSLDIAFDEVQPTQPQRIQCHVFELLEFTRLSEPHALRSELPVDVTGYHQ